MGAVDGEAPLPRDTAVEYPPTEEALDIDPKVRAALARAEAVPLDLDPKLREAIREGIAALPLTKRRIASHAPRARRCSSAEKCSS